MTRVLLFVAVLLVSPAVLAASPEPSPRHHVHQASAKRASTPGISDRAVKVSLPDLVYAAADAKAHAADARQACWQAWHDAVVQTQPAKLAARGMALQGHGGATRLEVKAQAIDAWGTKSAFRRSCGQLAKSMGMSLDAFVRAATE